MISRSITSLVVTSNVDWSKVIQETGENQEKVGGGSSSLDMQEQGGGSRNVKKKNY